MKKKLIFIPLFLVFIFSSCIKKCHQQKPTNHDEKLAVYEIIPDTKNFVMQMNWPLLEKLNLTKSFEKFLPPLLFEKESHFEKITLALSLTHSSKIPQPYFIIESLQTPDRLSDLFAVEKEENGIYKMKGHSPLYGMIIEKKWMAFSDLETLRQVQSLIKDKTQASLTQNEHFKNQLKNNFEKNQLVQAYAYFEEKKSPELKEAFNPLNQLMLFRSFSLTASKEENLTIHFLGDCTSELQAESVYHRLSNMKEKIESLLPHLEKEKMDWVHQMILKQNKKQIELQLALRPDLLKSIYSGGDPALPLRPKKSQNGKTPIGYVNYSIVH